MVQVFRRFHKIDALRVRAPRTPAESEQCKGNTASGDGFIYHAWGGSSVLQTDDNLRGCREKAIRAGKPCLMPVRVLHNSTAVPWWSPDCRAAHTSFGRAFWEAFNLLPLETREFCMPPARAHNHRAGVA